MPADETLDSILGGAISLFQPRRGYRFSVDSMLLGRFVAARPHQRVLELGAGCGVIALMLAHLGRPREVLALELQPRLADLIASNARLNDLATVRAICADLRARRIAELEPASFDLVVANPPYRALRTGRDVPERGRRLGRTETGAGLRDFVAAARRFVRNGGRVALVFTASRSAELIATLREYRLEPKRIRFVHPRASAPAASCLIEARADGGVEVTVEPPLWLHEGTGEYTAEARWWLGLETAPRNQARNSDASSAMR